MPSLHGRGAVGQRLAKRANQVDPERVKLLEHILEESSSGLLNDASVNLSPKQALDNHGKLLDLLEQLREVENRYNPELPRRNEVSWNRFTAWMQDQSKDTSLFDRLGISNQKSVCTLDKQEREDHQEYALFSKVPIKKDDLIFSINRKTMLSTETVMNDVDLFDFIKNDSIASAMQNVILVLHLLNEYSKGERSPWSAYLSILPKKILPVLRLDKKKFTHLLASSHTLEALKMVRAIARQYSYFFGQLQASNLPISKNLTYEFYCWGVSMVCSRQNEIPCTDRKSFAAPVVHALIPVLDLCNHDVLSSQAVYENNQSKLYASKDLGVDDEISLNYGCRSSGDFFIHNGFEPEKVPFDAIPFTITLNRSDKLFPTKSKLLKVLNMPIMGKFKLTPNNYENRHKRDPHLTMFLIVHSMSEDELDFVLDSENPVGLADEIYEHLQYIDKCSSPTIPEEDVSIDANGDVDVSQMKKRLQRCVKDYLSRRASISIALIDRALNELGDEDSSLSRLLNHERAIYTSHLINC